MESRALGWVQDASIFSKLRIILEVFSPAHNSMHAKTLQARLGGSAQAKSEVLQALTREPVVLGYKQLVGRKNKDDGVLPSVLAGQKAGSRLSSWATDNFVRWAEALGYLDFDRAKDSFSLTSEGRKLLQTSSGSDAEKALRIETLLTYPPACRILQLLGTGPSSHYALGAQLGFIGDPGFTSYSEASIVRALEVASPAEKSKIKSDVEGSSDKYARTICGWLAAVGLVETIQVQRASRSGKLQTLKAYELTVAGQRALTRVNGKSRHARPPQRVSWEMMATKGASSVRNYRRSTRAALLQELAVHTGGCTVKSLQSALRLKNFSLDMVQIEDDLRGLQRIGIALEEKGSKWILKSTVVGLTAPSVVSAMSAPEEDAELRASLTHLDHKYLLLVELSRGGSKASREFEVYLMDLLIDALKLEGAYLGGPHRPDGVVYTEDRAVVLDAKAYSKGYGLSQADQDAMHRYVSECMSRKNLPGAKTTWWETLPSGVSEYAFCFVSSSFTPGSKDGLLNLSARLGLVRGSGLGVKSLLEKANYLLKIKADPAAAIEHLFFLDDPLCED